MNTELEARIRARAYQLWESDPSPDGRADAHWEEARKQIEAEEESIENAQAEAVTDQRSEPPEGQPSGKQEPEGAGASQGRDPVASASATRGGEGVARTKRAR